MNIWEKELQHKKLQGQGTVGKRIADEREDFIEGSNQANYLLISTILNTTKFQYKRMLTFGLEFATEDSNLQYKLTFSLFFTLNS